LLILLSILAVFAPAFVMSGIPRSMFLPLSLAVGFAMIASFLLSQTFVPVLANWLLKVDHRHHDGTLALDHEEAEQLIHESEHPESKTAFDRLKQRYLHVLEKTFSRGKFWIFTYLIGSVVIIGAAFFFIGTDILPKSNSRQFQLRIKAVDGTRVERTEEITLLVLDLIKEEVGNENVDISSAYVGNVPTSYGTSQIFVFNSGPHEAVMQVSLNKTYDVQIDELKERLRKRIGDAMPSLRLSFEPIELVDKIMSQGASTPLEVSVAARDIRDAEKFARRITEEMRKISFLRDVQIAQPMDYPMLRIEMDRERAGQMGVTPSQVARSLVAATSSSRFTDKNLWLDNSKGLAYQVQIQIPEYQMNSVDDIRNIPLQSGQIRPTLADVATLSEEQGPGQYDRSGPNRLVTITANLHQVDLGTASKAVAKAIENAGEVPRGMVVDFKGQVKLLTETLSSLQGGLGVAIVIICLMLAANFQSFRLSFTILSSIPAVLVGSLVTLLLCGATLNLQSYMGMIMSVGVSVANAILMITNAENLRIEIKDARKAAVIAASSRLRPILMTSIAMIAGMVPMALGLGEGGDQIAPLGQAVIGGLVASTLVSLLILPVVFKVVQDKASFMSVSLDPEDRASKFFKG
jgi:multidrug efflux pump subunit AcrB